MGCMNCLAPIRYGKYVRKISDFENRIVNMPRMLRIAYKNVAFNHCIIAIHSVIIGSLMVAHFSCPYYNGKHSLGEKTARSLKQQRIFHAFNEIGIFNVIAWIGLDWQRCTCVLVREEKRKRTIQRVLSRWIINERSRKRYGRGGLRRWEGGWEKLIKSIFKFAWKRRWRCLLAIKQTWKPST